MRVKSNKIKDIVSYAYDELKNTYDKEEIKSLVFILFKQFANLNSAFVLAFQEKTINESELLNIVLAIKDLKHNKPIQQIIGKVDFLNLSLSINEYTLIPRPETEEMTKMIIDENKEEKGRKIIDICCGSGCIALSLSKNIKDSKVFACDISKEALEVAKENNKKLNLNVEFFLCDVLKDILTNEEFDIIVSNPPYVRNSEKEFMQKNVLDYEPALALFVSDENPLVFYEKIEFFARKHLKKDGKIYLEINNSLAKQTALIFSKSMYITEIKKDLFDKERFIFIKKIA